MAETRPSFRSSSCTRRYHSVALSYVVTAPHGRSEDEASSCSHSNGCFFGLPPSSQRANPKRSKPCTSPVTDATCTPTKLFCISQVYILNILALFPAFLHAPQFLRAFGFLKMVSARPPTIMAFLLLQMLLTSMEAFIGIALNFVSRRFEREADRFVYSSRID
ncbi:hypothetical protein JVU11DRAFT_6835 [Chiua virens]|nr:hypothetical protein JVU11DRAFT_6835 [Chiua virens]